MDKALWIARKNYLCTIIKKVADIYGTDDIEFVRQHCREVLDMYLAHKIEEAIESYEEVLKEHADIPFKINFKPTAKRTHV